MFCASARRLESKARTVQIIMMAMKRKSKLMKYLRNWFVRFASTVKRILCLSHVNTNHARYAFKPT